jgi:hypothetical protein
MAADNFQGTQVDAGAGTARFLEIQAGAGDDQRMSGKESVRE